MSVPALLVWLARKFHAGLDEGFLEMKLMMPAIASPPYREEELPLISSTCLRSSGGICIMLSPLLKPLYIGNPSFNNWVYFPSRPRMRIWTFPDDADVCWVCMPEA